jgi:L-ribulose-5-phosphate 3-epimerase
MSSAHADRRQFLATSVALGGMAMVGTHAETGAAEPEEKRFRKAVKIGMVGVKGSLTEKFKLLKELGFDGVELDSPGGPTPEEVAAAKEASGLTVHGVVDSAHWQQTLSSADADIRAKGVEALKTAIKMSKAYGGTSVLLVPGVVKDGVTYEQCWQRSIPEIQKCLPVAEEHGIMILLENVWNNFLTDPKETVRYIDEISSKLVGAYFDVGNAVKFSPPHEWVPILGQHIKKLDIKDYGKAKGFGHDLLEGDVDWPKVMAELRKLDYRGWGTAEIPGGGKERLAEIAKRMDKIYAS